MPVYRVTSPDGKVFDITAPEGASEADAIAYAQKQFGGAKAKPKEKPSTLKDAAKSAVTGVAKGLAPIADNLLEAGGLGALRLGADAANMLMGGRPRAGLASLDIAQRSTERGGHKPETRIGRYAESIGQNAVNALAPGGVLGRLAAVMIPGVAAEGAREAASAAGLGETGQGYAKAAGGVLGGVGASMRQVPSLPRRNPVPVPKQDPQQLATRAAEYRAAGIKPALVDVVDDSGRGAVRAAASRMTPARQRATDFQDARQLDLPSRMGGQARRVMSQDARTPDQIRAEMAARRSANAQKAFGAVRGDMIDVPPEAIQSMQTPYGRRAITEAANRERDPQVREALNQLVDQLDNPSGVQITVGMADRISRVLLSSARANANDPDLAATYTQLGESIRGPARTVSSGYADALEGFAADSRLQEAAGVGEDLLTRNTDEFVQQAAGLSDDERALALAAGRRAIERRAGENVGSAPGVARQVANAPEQQARNAALMGPERAEQLQQGMRLEERLVRNANDIAPRFGAQSQPRAQDAANMAAGIVQRGVQTARGDGFGAAFGVAVDWLRSRGMSDGQAEALVNMALDPARTDEAIQIIARRFGPDAAQQAIEWRRAALIGTTAIGAAAPDAE